MGTNCVRSYTTEITQYRKDLFVFMEVLGQGSFGKVWKAKQKITKTYCAIKVISKAKVLAKKSLTTVIKQRQILQNLHHPFIVNMIGAFQDQDNLYLIMDYLSGGDLRQFFRQHKVFDQKKVKFITKCLLMGLQYLRNANILHRDLKPENIIFDGDGYCRIADMGISKPCRQKNSHENSGTPGYMAPQVLNRLDHSFQVDYYALGVIIYQILIGHRPLSGTTRKQLKYKLSITQPQMPENPQQYSRQCVDFVNKLLEKNPQQRLGAKNINDIFNHPWLNMNQREKQSFLNKEIKSPIKVLTIPYQQENIELSKKQQMALFEAAKQLNNPEVQELFLTYDLQPVERKKKSSTKRTKQSTAGANQKK